MPGWVENPLPCPHICPMSNGFPFGLHARLFIEVMLGDDRPLTNLAELYAFIRKAQGHLVDEFGVVAVQVDDPNVMEHLGVLDLGTLWVGLKTSGELEHVANKMFNEALDLAIALDEAFPDLSCMSETIVIVPERTPHDLFLPLKNLLVEEGIAWGTTGETPRPHTVWQREEWSDAQHFIQPHNRLMFKLPRNPER